MPSKSQLRSMPLPGPEYVETQRLKCVWQAMIARCTNPYSVGFKNYGGRGIYVCSRWLVLENFLADMAPRPSPDHSIDRIDVNGPYRPDNCRWATKPQQLRNKTNNSNVTLMGVTLCITDWAQISRVKASTVLQRHASGMDAIRAITKPATGPYKAGSQQYSLLPDLSKLPLLPTMESERTPEGES